MCIRINTLEQACDIMRLYLHIALQIFMISKYSIADSDIFCAVPCLIINFALRSSTVNI